MTYGVGGNSFLAVAREQARIQIECIDKQVAELKQTRDRCESLAPEAAPAPNALRQADLLTPTDRAATILAQDGPSMGMGPMDALMKAGRPGLIAHLGADSVESVRSVMSEPKQNLEAKKQIVARMMERGNPQRVLSPVMVEAIHNAAAAYSVENLALLDHVGVSVTLVPRGESAFQKDVTTHLAPAQVAHQFEALQGSLDQVFRIVSDQTGALVEETRHQQPPGPPQPPVPVDVAWLADDNQGEPGGIPMPAMPKLPPPLSPYECARDRQMLHLENGLNAAGLGDVCTTLRFEPDVPGTENLDGGFLTPERLARQHGAQTLQEIDEFVQVFKHMNGERLAQAQQVYGEDTQTAQHLDLGNRPFYAHAPLVAPNYYLLRQKGSDRTYVASRAEVAGFVDWENGRTLGYFRSSTRQVLLREEQLEASTPDGDVNGAQWTTRHELAHALHLALGSVDPAFIAEFNQRLVDQFKAQLDWDDAQPGGFLARIHDKPRTDSSFPTAYASTKAIEMLPEQATAMLTCFPRLVVGGPTAFALIRDFLTHVKSIPSERYS